MKIKIIKLKAILWPFFFFKNLNPAKVIRYIVILCDSINKLHLYSDFQHLHCTQNCSTKAFHSPFTTTFIHQWVAAAVQDAVSPTGST